MPLAVDDVIDGKYRIVRQIGKGGMGEVWEGENTRIKRRVAIKILHDASAARADIVTRFEREAQAAGRIGNDHILDVYDLGALPSGDRYMVMEYLDGEPLSERFRRLGRMTPHQIAPIVFQVLNGLQAAHTAGIIHRDLKPDNLFLLRKRVGATDFVKIIDFGISKFSIQNPAAGEEFGMTRAGAMMGTPLYMAPEQANGSAEADGRSDVYAIGVILYKAVTGNVPFKADTFNELLFQIVLSTVPPVETLVPGIDPEFAQIIARAMERDRGKRFQSAQEMANALESWMSRNGVYVGTHTPLHQPPSSGATAAGAPAYGFGGHTPFPHTPMGHTPHGTPHPLTPHPITPYLSGPLAAANATPLQPATNVSWSQPSQPGTPPPAPVKRGPPTIAIVGIGLVTLGVLFGGMLYLARTLGIGDSRSETSAKASAKEGKKTSAPADEPAPKASAATPEEPSTAPAASTASTPSTPPAEPTAIPPQIADKPVAAKPAGTAAAPIATAPKPIAAPTTTKPAKPGKPAATSGDDMGY